MSKHKWLALIQATAAGINSASPLDIANCIGKWQLWSTSPPRMIMMLPPVLLPVHSQSFYEEYENVVIVSSLMVTLFSRRILKVGDFLNLSKCIKIPSVSLLRNQWGEA